MTRFDGANSKRGVEEVHCSVLAASHIVKRPHIVYDSRLQYIIVCYIVYSSRS